MNLDYRINRIETMGKGEDAGYWHFFLFPHVPIFFKTLYSS